MLHRFALLIVFIASAAAADPVAIGGALPALPVVTVDGASTTLAALRGERPLMLMTWCSSCYSCRGAEKAFDALVGKYKGRVPAYALAANPAETPALAQARQQESAISFPVVLDQDGAAADALGITCTTTVIVVDAKGAIAYRGPFAHAGTEAALTAVLDGKQPAIAEVEQFGCPLR